MDINFLGLLGNIIRLIIVFRFSLKKQQEASEKSFEKEEKKDVVVGSIAMIIFIIWGVWAYVIN